MGSAQCWQPADEFPRGEMEFLFEDGALSGFHSEIVGGVASDRPRSRSQHRSSASASSWIVPSVFHSGHGTETVLPYATRQPLKYLRDQEIRLISNVADTPSLPDQLFPGKNQVTRKWTLQKLIGQDSHTTDTSYEALSYCWGSTEEGTPYFLNGIYPSSQLCERPIRNRLKRFSITATWEVVPLAAASSACICLSNHYGNQGMHQSCRRTCHDTSWFPDLYSKLASTPLTRLITSIFTDPSSTTLVFASVLYVVALIVYWHRRQEDTHKLKFTIGGGIAAFALGFILDKPAQGIVVDLMPWCVLAGIIVSSVYHSVVRKVLEWDLDAEKGDITVDIGKFWHMDYEGSVVPAMVCLQSCHESFDRALPQPTS